MKLTVPILSTLALAPASAWTCGPRRGVVIRPSAPDMMVDRMMVSPQEMRRRKQAFFDRAFTRISPRYEVSDLEKEFKVSLDVPGVNAEDINVSFEEDGKVLSISGQRAKQTSTGSYTSKFSQSFALDDAVDVEKFTANLKNGVLVVTAPKDMQKIENNVRTIPITTNDVTEEVAEHVTEEVAEDVSEEVEVGSKEEVLADKEEAVAMDNDENPSGKEEENEKQTPEDPKEE